MNRFSCPTLILPRDPRVAEACRTLASVEAYETIEAVIRVRASLVCAPTTLAGLTVDDVDAMLATLGAL